MKVIVEITIMASIVSFVINNLLFKYKIGVIALSKNNEIVTTLCITSLFRYILRKPKIEFEKDCNIFFELLPPGYKYWTCTNSLVKKKLRDKLGRENIIVEKLEDRYIFISKILIGNLDGFFTKNYWKKKSYYKITFIK